MITSVLVVESDGTAFKERKLMQGPYFVDLFAGCGGLSLGLEMAGFSPVLVNELNKHAMETYLINRDDEFPLLRSKYHVNNIDELTAENFEVLRHMSNDFRADFGFDFRAGDLDLVVGGPPCQGFSGIGHRRSFPVNKEDLPSNHLFKEMAATIRFLRPKIFLFENVRGILTGRWTKNGVKGEIWEDVLTEFSTIPEYSVEWKLVRASQFGVPQNRPRVLLVGVREDIAVRIQGESFLPTTTSIPPEIPELLSDLVDPHYRNGGSTSQYPSPPQSEVQKRLRRPRSDHQGDPIDLVALSEHEYSQHSQHVVERFQRIVSGGGTIDSSDRTKKFAQRLLPSVWGPNGPSITATSLPDDYVHYCQPRTLTVREWARLQMFPDWYQFAGPRTTGGQRRAGNPQAGVHERELPKYTQIGNAVPVSMAQAIGEHFQQLLELATGHVNVAD